MDGVIVGLQMSALIPHIGHGDEGLDDSGQDHGGGERMLWKVGAGRCERDWRIPAYLAQRQDRAGAGARTKTARIDRARGRIMELSSYPQQGEYATSGDATTTGPYPAAIVQSPRR